MTTARSAEPLAPAAPDREIVATRTFAAPRELVWAAWTDPAHVARWWGPRGFTSTVSRMEVRAGGTWQLVMHGPDGTDYRNEWTYVEVVAPERIVMDHVSGPIFRMTATLVEGAGGTTVTMRMTFPTPAERAQAVKAYRADEGLAENLEKLGEELDGAGSPGGTAFFLPPGARWMFMRRVLDAPRRVVWEALTRPEHVARWYGPQAAVVTRCEVSAIPGGAWRVVQRFPDGAEHGFGGVYREVVPPERLVRTWRWDGAPAAESLETWTLAEREGRTVLTVRAEHLRPADRDGHVAAGMERGARETFDRLAALVAELNGPGAGPRAMHPA
jgi:uncharacterized protein YndB with AHSA1/START domain